MRKIMIAAAMAAATTAPAMAQIGNSQGLVNVTVQDVTILDDFLNDTQIAALNNLNVPITAQVPISVAANVCGTTVALLSAQRKAGDAACNATSGSDALAKQVARQRLSQKK
ncbi:MAG: hypothetical protein M3Q52_03670 [Pseudomonadota bacterium]|nr:hypothetical protein [Pseudomonadota bacterium]